MKHLNMNWLKAYDYKMKTLKRIKAFIRIIIDAMQSYNIEHPSWRHKVCLAPPFKRFSDLTSGLDCKGGISKLCEPGYLWIYADLTVAKKRIGWIFDNSRYCTLDLYMRLQLE